MNEDYEARADYIKLCEEINEMCEPEPEEEQEDKINGVD